MIAALLLLLTFCAHASVQDADVPGQVDRILAEEGHDRALAYLEEQRAAAAERGDRVGVADCWGWVAEVEADRHRFGAALDAARSSLALRRSLHPDGHPDVAVGLTAVSGLLHALGRPYEALEVDREALAVAHESLLGDHETTVSCLSNVAHGLQAVGRAREALPVYREALAMAERVHDGDHPQLAMCVNNVAYGLESLGRSEEALDGHRAALAMRRRLYPDGHRELAISLNNVGYCLVSLGRADEALPFLEEARALRERLGDLPATAESATNVAACLEQLGRPAEAAPLHAESLRLRRELFGGGHPRVAASLGNLASCLVSLGRHAEALPLYEEAVAVTTRNHPGDHPDLALQLDNLAHCLAQLGRIDESVAVHADALEMRERLLGGADHPSLAHSLNNVGMAHRAAGDRAAALPFLERALEMSRALYPEGHPARARALNNLGLCLEELGRFDEALPRLEQALAVARAAHAGPHVDVVRTLSSLAGCLDVLGRDAERVAALLEEAIEQVEALRGRTGSLSEEERADYFELLRRGNPYDRSRKVNVALGRTRKALDHTERGRARMLLDLLARGRAGSEAAPLSLAKPVTSEELQAALEPGELVLFYALDEVADQLFVVARDGPVEAFPLPSVRRAFEEGGLLPAGHANPAQPRGEPLAPPHETSSRSVAAAILPEGAWARARAARRVIVIPDGALHRTPFETLVVPERDGRRALWLDVGPPVAYAPSATSLCRLRRKEREQAAPGPLVALGDPIGALAALPASRREVESIAALFRADDPDGARTLLGEQATEAAAFEHAAGAGYLHFATHGLADEQLARSRSALVLTAPGEPAAGDDGRLELGELLERWGGRLEGCRLVVLSACRTNVGPTRRDEAVFALPVGFLHAGAQAVVASLWSVEDESTAILMSTFYRRLRAQGAQVDPLAALTEAKREVRRTYPEPRHWGAFLYIGAP